MCNVYSVTAYDIQKHLQNNPEQEQIMFTERSRFDLIVYYDQNSKSIEEPAINFRKALEPGQLRRPLMVLVGGFDAWQSTVGERGVFRFPNNLMKEKRHWFKSSSSTSASVGSFEQDTLLVHDHVSINLWNESFR
jgi:hypothetical protein